MIQQKTTDTQKRYRTHPKRMDVWYARIDRRTDSFVQGGNRPVLIVSNDINNAVSPVVTIIPITSKSKKTNQPTHVWVDSVSVVRNNADCGEGITTYPVTLPTTYPATEQTTYPAIEQTTETRGMILAEQITTIDKDRLVYLIGRLEDDELVSQVERAIDVQLGMI